MKALGLALILLFLLLVSVKIPRRVVAFGHMTTISTTWADDAPTHDYLLCSIQPESLLPSCLNNWLWRDPGVAPLTPLWAISSGSYFTCGLTYPNQNPICWGRSDSVSLTECITVPAAYRTIRYASLNAGAYHVCALRDDGLGTVDCWGSVWFGGETTPPIGVAMSAISLGRFFSWGLQLDGRSVLWGGHFNSGDTNVVPDPKSRYSAIFAGAYHVCGIEIGTKKTLCWGSNDAHECEPPLGYNFSFIAAGKVHTCGLRDDNHQAICWGRSIEHQLDAPKGVPFSTLSASNYYTCGVTLEKQPQMLCWGTFESNGTQLASMEGMCVANCSDNQYFIATGVCPTAGDKICVDCSICPNGTFSECMGSTDRSCSNFSSSPPNSQPSPEPPSPQPSQNPPTPHPSPNSQPSPNPAPPSNSRSPTSSKKSTYYIVGAAVGFFVVLVAVGLLMYCSKTQIIRQSISEKDPGIVASDDKKESNNWKESNNLGSRIQEFTKAQLQLATSNYSASMLVSRGASCLLYKGILGNGKVIAIKKPSNSENADYFDQELLLLRSTNHMYLVNLVGYCIEEKILVFEFMENGSLYDCLFTNKSIDLDWKTRIRIAAQTAKGLEYLHAYARPPIIHRDVKAANVLLDKNLNAHVADFGLSLFLPSVGDTHLSDLSKVLGTPGYLDPEYFQTSRLTTKSDVYSFGVMLLELFSGKKVFERGRELDIFTWISEAAENNDITSILDPSFKLPTDMSPLVEAIELGLKCVMRKSEDRPTMVFVAKALETCMAKAEKLDIMTMSSSYLTFGLESSICPR